MKLHQGLLTPPTSHTYCIILTRKCMKRELTTDESVNPFIWKDNIQLYIRTDNSLECKFSIGLSLHDSMEQRFNYQGLRGFH